MKRGLPVGIGAAAIVIAGASACSSADEKSETASSSANASASAGAHIKLTIDGVNQPLSNAPTCRTTGGTINIAFDEADMGVAAVIGAGDLPAVTMVALANIGGFILSVGPEGGRATAEKVGTAYVIKGDAVGADTTNVPPGGVTKPFELVVVCS